MSTKSADAAAAKAKKQKIILAVAGVALLGVAGLQVPKLMGGGGSATPPPAAAAATPAPVTATGVSVSTPSGSTATALKVSGPRQTAVLAGVTIPGGASPGIEADDLVAFSLFAAKDPFVQAADDGTAPTTDGSASASSTSSNSSTTTPTASGSSSGSADASTTTAAPKPPPIAYATIMFDGTPQQLQKKEKFPTANPMFVLVSLKKKQAKVGVAGGAFDDGKTVTLTQGKQVTLVNTATGVRYELKLVYTGSAPETIEGFSSTDGGKTAPPAATVTDPAAGSTSAAATP
jgi:hypothetical protein